MIRAIRVSATGLLPVGIAIGYLLFLFYLGLRLVPLLVGGAIALVSLTIGLKVLQQRQLTPQANVLDRSIFLHYLTRRNLQLTPQCHKIWQTVQAQALDTQSFANRIAQTNPSLIPELLETLQTVLALVEQVTDALVALENVKTQTYHRLATHHLQTSRDRLQKTHHQLQCLHDQTLLSMLHEETTVADIPNSLRILIQVNQTALQSRLIPPSTQERD